MPLPSSFAELIRLVAGKPCSKVPETPEGNIQPGRPEVDDGYLPLGAFPPGDADRILARFKEAGLRFQVDVDTSGPPMNRNGFGRTRRTVALFAHKDDATRAQQIIAADFVPVDKFEVGDDPKTP